MITKEQLATEATSGRAFAVVNDIVHDPDRYFEELQQLALTMASHIDAQAARIAELEQDAARYRWLRDHWHGFDHYRKARGTIADLTREIDEQIQKQQVTTATTIENLRCTCPSGDGSLRWPCPRHPPESA